jgi:transcriptional regulator with XRE-family HTH domain
VRFGERVRELRNAKNLSQRVLGSQVGVSFTYTSTSENERLCHPGEELVGKLAGALEVDEDEPPILAEKNPFAIRRRVMERTDASRKFAAFEDEAMNTVLKAIDSD